MGTYADLAEIRGAVEQNENILSMEMRELRDAYGAQRLKVNVRQHISDELASLGLGHFPEKLPDDQWGWVRLYKQGTPQAHLIQAVLNPGESHDNTLHAHVGDESEDIIRRIRELVCE